MMILHFLNTLAMCVVLLALYITPPMILAYFVTIQGSMLVACAVYGSAWAASLVTLRLYNHWRQRHVEDESAEFKRLRAKYFHDDEACPLTLHQLRAKESK